MEVKAQKNDRSWRKNKETELETEEEDFWEQRQRQRQKWKVHRSCTVIESLGMNFSFYISWKQGSTVTTLSMILIKNSHREPILQIKI